MKRREIPDYAVHEERYRARRSKPELYEGWFTAADYISGMKAVKEDLARGFAPRAGRLLDIGCGAGNYSLEFAARGFDVTGIDISATAIDWANERLASSNVRASFLCGDAVKMTDVPDDEFDFAFDGHFLHCILGPDRAEFLRNVRRVLRPDGFFLVRSIVWPVESSPDLEIDKTSRIGYVDGTPYRYYPDAEALVAELSNAGFEILDWRFTVTTDDGFGFQHVVVQCRNA